MAGSTCGARFLHNVLWRGHDFLLDLGHRKRKYQLFMLLQSMDSYHMQSYKTIDQKPLVLTSVKV